MYICVRLYAGKVDERIVAVNAFLLDIRTYTHIYAHVHSFIYLYIRV